MPTEEERAIEYRRKMQAREDNKLAREKAMSGNAIARDVLDSNWAPLRKWQGWEPVIKVLKDQEA